VRVRKIKEQNQKNPKPIGGGKKRRKSGPPPEKGKDPVGLGGEGEIPRARRAAEQKKLRRASLMSKRALRARGGKKWSESFTLLIEEGKERFPICHKGHDSKRQLLHRRRRRKKMEEA